jgi:hypothetical protein
MTKPLFAALAFSVALASLTAVPARAHLKGMTSQHESQEYEHRKKERVRGGSGCDDPEDVREHPECR